MMDIDSPHEVVLSVFAHCAGSVEPHPLPGLETMQGGAAVHVSHAVACGAGLGTARFPCPPTAHEVRAAPDPR